MLIVYSFGLFAALVVGLPYWLLRMATSGKYRAGLGQRLGVLPPGLAARAQKQKTIWLHAVSVGEVIAVSRLIVELEAALPEYRIFLSTTTRTGQELAKHRFGSERVFYFPLDFAFIVRRYLKALNPAMLILAETEFWPNTLAVTATRRIPIVVVNARISDRSLPRYRALRALWRPLLAKVTRFCAQSDEDARRLKEIGAPAERVHSLGNLKFDVRAGSEPPLLAMLRTHLDPNAKILVCGSTLEGEESALLAYWPILMSAVPQLVCILAPRHPERFAGVARLLEQQGIAFARRSQWVSAPETLPGGSVFLLDSVGELASVYALADVAFVGGSLVAAGGHNPLEPAQFAVPVVMGESFENFRAIVMAMAAAQAIEIVPVEALCPVLVNLLTEKERAASLGRAAQGVFVAEAGATGRTVAAVKALLEGRSA